MSSLAVLPRTRLTFNQAAALYLTEKNKPSLALDINDLKKVMPFIGDYFIDQLNNSHLQAFIQSEQQQGKKHSTINRSLRVVHHLLQLCHRLWRDDDNQPYLLQVPLFLLLSEHDKKPTYALTFAEEKRLLAALNEDYQNYWLFAVNTGLRQHNQTGLRWAWEKPLSRFQTSAFLIPAFWDGKPNTKNQRDFLLLLNQPANAIIEQYRGKHDTVVFPSPKGSHYHRFNNKHFRNARKKADLVGKLNWHSARATFSTRLKAVGVSEENRGLLLGHVSTSVTSHYSKATTQQLLHELNQIKQQGEVVDSLADELLNMHHH